MSNDLVAYSLAVPDGGLSPRIVRQLEISWRSLRRFDQTQPVVLFMHGPTPEPVARLSRSLDVMVDEGPTYPDRLRAFAPTGAEALAAYPVLHKFLNADRLATSGADHVLCCDLDTVFADDVTRIFDRYRTVASVVAREEVNCRRSPYGYDPTFIDEELLDGLAAELGVRRLPPFNLGAVLLNRPNWHDLIATQREFVDLAWRFVTWMSDHPVGVGSRFGEYAGFAEAQRDATAADHRRALPFPSSNRWILDEVCLWLALGRHAPTYADFDPRDVAQNGEFGGSHPAHPGWAMCHYFSSTLDHVERWLRHAA